MAAGRHGDTAVKAPDFAYLRPDSLDGVFAALARYGDDARILAGGQTLMALQNMRLAAAEILVDINRVPGLSGITEADGHIAIGALTRYAALAESSLVARHAPLLAEAVPFIAHAAIRNRGTIGGSLALGDPAAEMPACMLALGADLELSSEGGVRQVAAEEFFLGLYETALRPDEVLTTIHVPKARIGQFYAIDEIVRRRGDFALAGLAVSGTAQGGSVQDIRLAYFGVADRPILAETAMSTAMGRPLDDAAIAEIREAVLDTVDPPEDPVTPAAYRRHVAGVLTERVLHRIQKGLA